MPSYLSSNLNFAGKTNPFNNSKEKIIQKDEESGEEDKGFAGAENFIEPNKRSQQNLIPHERKIFCIILIGILRYFSMFHYGRWTFSSFVPEKYINPCNGTNLMSIDDIDLLKHNITHVHEELKSISVVNGYHLNNNATAFLNDMHRNHTASLINFEVELDYQRNEYFNCYVRNIQNYMEPQKLIIFGFIFLMVVLYLMLFYYMIKAKTFFNKKARTCKFDEKQVQNFKNFFVASIFMVLVDVMFVCFFMNELHLDSKYAKFPL